MNNVNLYIKAIYYLFKENTLDFFNINIINNESNFRKIFVLFILFNIWMSYHDILIILSLLISIMFKFIICSYIIICILKKINVLI